MEEKLNFNISIIAGYDVLAYKNLDHIKYVTDAVIRSMELNTDVIIFVGGTTNPDHPTRNEAMANCVALQESFLKNVYEIWEIDKELDTLSLLQITKKTNRERMDKFQGNTILPVKVLPVGNTSTETLEAAKEFIEKNKISIGRLILCAEQSRITGFMADALMVGLLDLSEEIFAYGHRFPESKQGFDSQRKKMLLKVLSHRSKFFRYIREICQEIHQHKVARLKRKQK